MPGTPVGGDRAPGDGREHGDLIAIGHRCRGIRRVAVAPDPAVRQNRAEAVAVPLRGRVEHVADSSARYVVAPDPGGLTGRSEQEQPCHLGVEVTASRAQPDPAISTAPGGTAAAARVRRVIHLRP